MIRHYFYEPLYKSFLCIKTDRSCIEHAYFSFTSSGEMEEFVIPLEHRDLLLSKSSRICRLFNVQVVLQNGSSGNRQWVKICSATQGNPANLKTAKDYITSLCCPETPIEIIPYSSRSVINIDDIAVNYGVIADVVVKENILTLKGSQINVALAKSWIENEGSSACETDVSNAMESCKSFARKLGYSADDIEVVAKALWPHGPVDKNAFLEELVRRKRSERNKRRDIVPRGFAARSMAVGDADPSQQQQRQIIEVPRYTDDQAQADGGCHGDLCPIIIDGSNVAMHHGSHRVFSCRGIALCVEWFHKRGHQEVFALVPRYRADPQRSGTPPFLGCPIEDQHLLLDMVDKGVVKLTPSKQVKDGKDIVCYDDRFIIELACKLDGVVVSNDGYRDLVNENASWKYIIEKRVLMFSFVRDLFMVPEDPLGRKGPALTDFLKKGTNIKHAKICPWIGKCTFGPMCRYYHPEKETGKTAKQSDHMKLKTDNGVYTPYENKRDQQQQQQQPQPLQQQQQHEQRQHYQQHSPQVGHHDPLHQPQPQSTPMYHYMYQHDYYNQPASRTTYTHHQPWSYEADPAYSQQTIFVPTQYSYTPPNSFSYNNSAALNDRDHETLHEKLIEVFPEQEQRITKLLQDKPQIQDITILIERILDQISLDD